MNTSYTFRSVTLRPGLSQIATAAAMLALIGAGPTTAPTGTAAPIISAPAPTAAPGTVAPTTAPAAPIVTPTPAAVVNNGRLQDNGNNNYNRRDRGNRSRSGGSNNSAYTGDPTAAEAAAMRGDYSGTPGRSLFIKGNQDLTSRPTPVVEAPRPVEIPQGPFRGTPETLLIFNGAVIEDNEPAAFVEDIKTNLVSRVRPGDGVAGGVVTSVSLDELTFVVKGQTRHVHLGENFAGTAAITSTVAPAAPPTLTVNGVQVIGTGASLPIPVAAPGSGISKEDIEARMRARRDQENKGIGK